MSDITCKWEECNTPHATTDELANHLQVKHLNSTANKCLWLGCLRSDEQSSRNALLAHIKVHSGETPYFCLVPECEKYFSLSDELSKHVSKDHDLHTISESSGYLATVEHTYELTTPWWFSLNWVNALGQKQPSVGNLYDLPVNFKQHEVASLRYKTYLSNQEDLISPDVNRRTVNVIKLQKRRNRDLNREKMRKLNQPIGPETDEEELDEELAAALEHVHSHLSQTSAFVKSGYRDLNLENVNDCKSAEELELLYNKLSSRLNTASRINKLVSVELAAKTVEKRKLWLVNQLLIDSNLIIGLPPRENSIQERVELDEIDEDLLG